MMCIVLRRVLAGHGTRQSMGGQLLRKPTIGRQGKSAASGRAHMVGQLEFGAPSSLCDSWRFSRKPQRFQCFDRRRHLELICAR